MKKFDFSLFTDRQLGVLSEQVKAEIAHRRELASRLMRNRGGLVEGSGPRYRNPQNAAETWSGRGKRPAWIEAALAQGSTLDDLEVTDNRPTAKSR